MTNDIEKAYIKNRHHSALFIERWGLFQLAKKGPKKVYPFKKISLSALINVKKRILTINGFTYDEEDGGFDRMDATYSELFKELSCIRYYPVQFSVI
jgi:hypothetical protein